MYILLVGYPPFGGPTDNAILRRVRKGQYTFTGPHWGSVSEDAKHCIKRMLLMKPGSRATAAQLLEEKWFKDASAVSDKVECFCASAPTQTLQLACLCSMSVSTMPEGIRVQKVSALLPACVLPTGTVSAIGCRQNATSGRLASLLAHEAQA